jgi:hypothetical protein
MESELNSSRERVSAGRGLPGAFYQEQVLSCQGKIDRRNTHSRRLGWLKLIVMTILVALIMMRVWRLDVLLPLVFAFVALAVCHEGILSRQRRGTQLLQINEDEKRYLAHDFPRIHRGVEFNDSGHDFADDLDLFADKGLFHYVSRCQTFPGRKKLADWLKAGPWPDLRAIGLRQEAARELADRTGFRQEMQRLGSAIVDSDSGSKLEALRSSFHLQPLVSHRLWLKLILAVFPPLTLLSIGLVIAARLPYWMPWTMILCQLSLNMIFARRVNEQYRLTSRSSRILQGYVHMMQLLERQSFSSVDLQRVGAVLRQDGRPPASRQLMRLATLLQWLDVRASGTLHVLVNNIFLWDLQCIQRLEKVRAVIKEHAVPWLEAVGEVEALASLGNLYFNHPGWGVPLFQEKFALSARAIGHPLLPQAERVSASIAFQKKGEIAIITGPNMAGKSTFLRTIGVNLVLAYAGGPVCADEFIVSPFRLHSSMKTSDSLEKGVSYFYAELSRLKRIIDAVESGEPVLFLVDEMLKGTNALDRQKGSVALIRQMLASGTNGLLATHDLELARLEQNYPGAVVNFHFDSFIRDNQLVFDYRLKPGYCRSFNAMILMTRIGIRCEEAGDGS